MAIRVLIVVALATFVAALVGREASARSTCDLPNGAHLVRATELVTLYYAQRGDDLLACSHRTGLRTRVGANHDFRWFVKYALDGDYVAYGRRYCPSTPDDPPYCTRNEVGLLRVSTGRRSCRARLSARRVVRALVNNVDGQLGWIDVGQEDFSFRVEGCKGESTETLDSGDGINPHSLTMRGQWVHWLSRETPRSARLG